MGDWWQSLSAVNQWFFAAAAFFSVFFAWQLIAAIIGLGGHEDADMDADTDVDHMDMDHADGDFAHGDHPEIAHDAAVDAHETVAAFKLLSIRSILAFFTLFTWGTALYLNLGKDLGWAMTCGVIWGLVGMVAVALIFYMMRRLTETGTPRLASCVGTNGSVCLDIPAGGVGEVRVMVSGAMSHVRARAADARPVKAGTPIRVTRLLDASTIEVTTPVNAPDKP